MVKQFNPNLSDGQKQVLFNKGTEAPGTGAFLRHDKSGTYTCANCGAELFKSTSKYESGIPSLAGWPSFASAAKEGAVMLRDDDSLGMHRQEAVCANCGGHLGHLFSDDTSPSGLHYCINSVSLSFNDKNKNTD